MFSERAFFSFVQLTDATTHREYNEWHQLDHRPENLLLPGVAWGDRWARPAEYVPLHRASSADLIDIDYVAMYWFRPPYDESVAAWTKLGEDSFQWGRGPLLPGIRRPLLGFFTPVKGYAAPRINVSADALPFRPNRGLHLSVTHLADPHGTDAHEWFRWQDRVEIPALLSCPGVAGAWTFALHSLQKHPTLPRLSDDRREFGPGTLRIRLLYLDADPAEVTAALDDIDNDWAAAGHGPESVGELLFHGPLRTIIPWQDW
ncbi:hypothetical protein SAMN05421776_11135 [Nocardia farcinica]|uniref:Uncharacterized protein n=1 Tax=Nocardia farcinica TaxID=37329 RepID=A0A0H5NWU9_NOCFR|nr:hypothetical protein [Nocardia farcinica]AXK84244.1 hypothetical protein DXT66_00030 [Nocardia farcinica]CRY74496.1 Uncharacterised protein [Nocardia farcinica]SIT31670.1 hypothetical protein SAMN05421776_11135 [Nocardia farcinica]